MSWKEYVPLLGNSSPVTDVAAALDEVRGDAEAIAFLPYDDGTFWMKPASYEKSLLGGKGGYETPDGDTIVADGEGVPTRELLGVPIITAADPAEHVGAVETVKAMIAEEANMGRWVKTDRENNVVAVGDALEPAPDSDVDPGPEGTAVETRAQELAGQHADRHGGVVDETQFYEQAMQELEAEGEITKIADLAPPAEVVDGEVEQATHVPVDISKATDLLPTTINNTELQTELDKARLEEFDEDVRSKYLVYGLIIGTILASVLMGGTGALFFLLG
jgi:hypothetical protein